MKKIIAFILLLASPVFAQWSMLSRQVSVTTNSFTVIPATNNTAQKVFDWLDDNLLLLGPGGYGTNTYLNSSAWNCLMDTPYLTTGLLYQISSAAYTNLGTNTLQQALDNVDSWLCTIKQASTNIGPFLKGTNIVGATYDTDTSEWTIDWTIDWSPLNDFSNTVYATFLTKTEFNDFLSNRLCILVGACGTSTGITESIITFSHTGTTQTYTPTNTGTIEVHAWGAAGGGGGWAAPGGYSYGVIQVVTGTPATAYQVQTGTVLTIEVGSRGGTTSSGVGFGAPAGGSTSLKAGGGGRSAVWKSNSTSEYIVAGGGGGAGGYSDGEFYADADRNVAGSGGGSSGNTASGISFIGLAGGGSQSAGGAGGVANSVTGNSGARQTGADRLDTVAYAGASGGGGGGYYGGGSGGRDSVGRYGAGGGGSGYIGGVSNGMTSVSAQSTSKGTRNPPGTTSIYYGNNAGQSGSANGEHGRVVFVVRNPKGD